MEIATVVKARYRNRWYAQPNTKCSFSQKSGALCEAVCHKNESKTRQTTPDTSREMIVCQCQHVREPRRSRRVISSCVKLILVGEYTEMWQLADVVRKRADSFSCAELTQRCKSGVSRRLVGKRRDCVCRTKTVSRLDLGIEKVLRINRETDDVQGGTGRSQLSNVVCEQMSKQHVSVHVTPVCESSKCSTQKTEFAKSRVC